MLGKTLLLAAAMAVLGGAALLGLWGDDGGPSHAEPTGSPRPHVTEQAAQRPMPLQVQAQAPVVAEMGGNERERCLAVLREDPDAGRNFATAWEQRGGGEPARHCAALALLAAGDPVRAAERLEAIAARSASPAVARAAIFGEAVQAWLLAGEPNRAFAAATMALTLVPDDPELLLDRAIALASQGRHAEALGDLERAGGVAPERADIWVLRATALRRTERAVEAERAVARALTIEPDNAEALLERGILRQQRGDRAGATADWRRVLLVGADSPAADLAQQNLALNEAGPQRR